MPASTSSTSPPAVAQCAADAADDNLVYDGNVYTLGQGPRVGQWSQPRSLGGADLGDSPATRSRRCTCRPIRMATAIRPIQLLFIGTWRVSVFRGSGGAVPGMVTRIDGPDEDTNGNHRLDPGEDDDMDGLLDAAGQPYALVVAGPVLGVGFQVWDATQHDFPQNLTNLDKALYGCSDDVVVQVFDPDGTVAGLEAGTTLTVQDAAGAILDSEQGFAFSEDSARQPRLPLGPDPGAAGGPDRRWRTTAFSKPIPASSSSSSTPTPRCRARRASSSTAIPIWWRGCSTSGVRSTGRRCSAAAATAICIPTRTNC